jgi:hypothetical protein
MEAIKNKGYIVLVARLPSPDDVDRESIERSAHNAYIDIPSLSQSRIATANSKFENETIDILKKVWELPDLENQISKSDIFLSKTFQEDQKNFMRGVAPYLSAQNNSESPFVIIASPTVLNAILDILEIQKVSVRWTVNAWVAIVDQGAILELY